ncbi:MAG TPA: hypothetical protein VKT82_31115 [Ktedonobacterales bacterium]|nr:hypothetical protein [Ktedonobacterales bacterium]
MRKYAHWRRRISVWMMGWSLMVVLLLGGCASGSAVNWQGIGPNGTSIVSLALTSLNQPTLFAGSSGQGLFRSQDDGSTWTTLKADLPAGITINSIVLDQTQIGVVYLGTDAGVFVSTSNGDHWQSASQGLPGRVDGAVTTLLVNPDDPKTLYAGTAHKGVYVSHDAAKSWSPSVQGLPTGVLVHTLMAEIKGDAIRLFAGLAGAGVYQSSDNGATWSASNTGLPAGVDGLSMLQQPSNPGGLYLGTSAGVYRSIDDGATWKAASAGLGEPAPQVFALALNDEQVQFLYAATSAGVYRSADGGTSWGQVAGGIPTAHPVVAMVIVGSASSSLGTIFVSDGQVYRYPSATGSLIGGIFTFVVLGVLALLFLWLFLQQRRLLRRLTVPTMGRGGPSGPPTERPDPGVASIRRGPSSEAVEEQGAATPDGTDEGGSSNAASNEHH